MADYRNLIFENVIQPNQGVRRIQSGVATLTGGTTQIPISALQSHRSKVYLVTSHLNDDRNTGAQGYIAELRHAQRQIEVVVSPASFAGSISWQIIEIY